MAAAVARQAGARYVVMTDLNEYRLELARKMGVTRAVNVRATSLKDVMQELNIENGFTVGLEMPGHSNGLRTLLEDVRHGDHLALLGILPPDTAIN